METGLFSPRKGNAGNTAARSIQKIRANQDNWTGEVELEKWKRVNDSDHRSKRSSSGSSLSFVSVPFVDCVSDDYRAKRLQDGDDDSLVLSSGRTAAFGSSYYFDFMRTIHEHKEEHIHNKFVETDEKSFDSRYVNGAETLDSQSSLRTPSRRQIFIQSTQTDCTSQHTSDIAATNDNIGETDQSKTSPAIVSEDYNMPPVQLTLKGAGSNTRLPYNDDVLNYSPSPFNFGDSASSSIIFLSSQSPRMNATFRFPNFNTHFMVFLFSSTGQLILLHYIIMISDDINPFLLRPFIPTLVVYGALSCCLFHSAGRSFITTLVQKMRDISSWNPMIFSRRSMPSLSTRNSRINSDAREDCGVECIPDDQKDIPTLATQQLQPILSQHVNNAPETSVCSASEGIRADSFVQSKLTSYSKSVDEFDSSSINSGDIYISCKIENNVPIFMKNGVKASTCEISRSSDQKIIMCREDSIETTDHVAEKPQQQLVQWRNHSKGSGSYIHADHSNPTPDLLLQRSHTNTFHTIVAAAQPAKSLIILSGVPCVVSLFGFLLKYYALTFTIPSEVQAIASSIILLFAFGSMPFLRLTIRRNHFFSVLFLLLAVALLSIFEANYYPILTLCLVGQFFQFLYVALKEYNQYLHERIYNSETDVGFDGFCGFTILLIFYFVSVYIVGSTYKVWISVRLGLLLATLFIVTLIHTIESLRFFDKLTISEKGLIEIMKIISLWIYEWLYLLCNPSVLSLFFKSWFGFVFQCLGTICFFVGLIALNDIFHIPYISPPRKFCSNTSQFLEVADEYTIDNEYSRQDVLPNGLLQNSRFKHECLPSTVAGLQHMPGGIMREEKRDNRPYILLEDI